MTTHTQKATNTYTHKAINTITHTSLIKQKQIDEHVNTIGKRIHDVNGHNSDEATEFIFKYLHHLTTTRRNLCMSIS